MAEFTAELIIYLEQLDANATQYERGKLQGRVAFEAATLLIGEIKLLQVGQIAKITKFSFLQKLGARLEATTFPRVETARQAATLATARTAEALRNSTGIVTGGTSAAVTGRWLKGSHGNAGEIPGQVAAALRGRTFNTFDEFRSAFRQAVAADSNLARQFSPANVQRMSNGLSPIAPVSQQVGGLRSYVLHHKKPVHAGGAVYDLDNLFVVTPRLHKEILDPAFHFGRSQ